MEDYFDFDEDEDIETVFDAMDAHARKEAKAAHDELLSGFFRDGVRIRHLETSDDIVKAGLDVSTLATEVVGALPKEWADDQH